MLWPIHTARDRDRDQDPDKDRGIRGFFITLCTVHYTGDRDREPLLQPADEVAGKVMFLHLSVILFMVGGGGGFCPGESLSGRPPVR